MKPLSRLYSLALALALAPRGVQAQAPDPRVGLKAGMTDAGVAARGFELLSSTPRPVGFNGVGAAPLPAGVPPVLADILYANSDFAFRGNTVVLGNFRGFQIYDVANPRAPRLVTAFLCPGGQGDVSVYRNLLFMSVEMPNGQVDCGDVPLSMGPDPKRFMGVRIFDISDLAHPRQVGMVQTCRGSHTHTLVTDPKDPADVYIYVSGVSHVRPATELAGCSALPPEQDPKTALFRIDIIKVPLAHPENAAIVNSPRIFADSGKIAGLWPGGSHGEGTQETSRTDQCHDITVYEAIGLAAGACSGNGLLLDISNPANPRRIDQVNDPNFAYWHSATFNNDGTKVIYTDEWGGGMAPRCRSSDRPQWGADAIYQLSQRKLTSAGYYKLPAPQTDVENCVAHNGSLVPVPGRDIMVQGWYQGGVSMFDFTDAQHPVEIGYFDRGPYNADTLHLGGVWSAYWYNGDVYSSEIQRGLDIFQLAPTDMLTQNEIDAARLVHMTVFNPQHQTRFSWPASFVVARAYLDQLGRSQNVSAITSELDKAEKLKGAQKRSALQRLSARVRQLETTSPADARRVTLLSSTLQGLAKP